MKETFPLIGLIGGTSWASTVEYYRLMNQMVNRRLGGLNYARCLIYSLNYGDIDLLNNRQDYDGILQLLVDAAKRLEDAGVSCLVLGANTLHRYADALEKEVSAPIIHIADATAHAIRKDGLDTVGLMGTKQTMELDFYTKRLQDQGIATILPEYPDRDYIDKIIRTELVRDLFTPEARNRFLQIIENLHQKGAQGVVLGCTEIPLLISQKQSGVKLYNTLEIHAEAVVDFYMSLCERE